MSRVNGIVVVRENISNAERTGFSFTKCKEDSLRNQFMETINPQITAVYTHRHEEKNQYILAFWCKLKCTSSTFGKQLDKELSLIFHFHIPIYELFLRLQDYI